MAAIHVRVLNRVGSPVMSCPIDDLKSSMLDDLIVEHERILIERVVPPKGVPLIPSEYPFRDAPKFCSTTAAKDPGKYRFILSVPLVLKHGGVHPFVISLSSPPDQFAFKKAFRTALHRRVPLTEDQLLMYRDWYDSHVSKLFDEAMASVIAREAKDEE